jgi:hypothetical protein
MKKNRKIMYFDELGKMNAEAQEEKMVVVEEA